MPAKEASSLGAKAKVILEQFLVIFRNRFQFSLINLFVYVHAHVCMGEYVRVPSGVKKEHQI